MSINDRIRGVDVEKMSPKEVDNLSVQLGSKAGKLIEQTSKDINKFLNIYGLEVAINYQFTKKSNKTAGEK